MLKKIDISLYYSAVTVVKDLHIFPENFIIGFLSLT